MRRGGSVHHRIIDSRTVHDAHVRIAELFGGGVTAYEFELEIENHEVSRRRRRDTRCLTRRSPDMAVTAGVEIRAMSVSDMAGSQDRCTSALQAEPRAALANRALVHSRNRRAAGSADSQSGRVREKGTGPRCM